MDSPYMTSYQQNFCSKRVATEKSCKPVPVKSSSALKTSYCKTEYQGQFSAKKQWPK